MKTSVKQMLKNFEKYLIQNADNLFEKEENSEISYCFKMTKVKQELKKGITGIKKGMTRI